MNRHVFKNIVDKNDLEIYMYYDGEASLDPNQIYPIIENVLNSLNKNITYDELLSIIRNIFKDFKEKELILNFNKKNEIYSSRYIDKELIELSITKQVGYDIEVIYEYIKDLGLNYSVNIKNNLELDKFSNYLLNDVPNKVKKIKKN